MTDLLKDLLDIPATTGAEDYVLRLTDSVGERSRSALKDYVVTEDIAAAFDQALGLVSDALAENTSRADEPSRCEVTSRRVDSALVTLTPTPCRPPEKL